MKVALRIVAPTTSYFKTLDRSWNHPYEENCLKNVIKMKKFSFRQCFTDNH